MNPTGESLPTYMGVRISIHNKDYCRGCSFPEDDWTIRAIGSDLQDAIANIIPEYVSSGINPDSVWASEVVYVIFQGERVLVKDYDVMLPGVDTHSLEKSIEAHPDYKRHLEIKENKEAQEKQIAADKAKKIKEDADKAELKRLLDLYGAAQ